MCLRVESAEQAEVEEGIVAIDANGNKLADGDTVTLIKDLKVKGAPKDLKTRNSCEKHPYCRG